MSHDEFVTLASQLVDGKLSDEQMVQLESHLRDHPEAREVLVQHLFLDAMLTNELGAESVAGLVDMVASSDFTTLPMPKARSRWIGWTLAGVAASILIAICAIAYSFRDGSPQVVENPPPAPPIQAPLMAKVEEQQGLELVTAKGESKIAAAGDEVKPGQTLRINGDDGYAVIKSNGSARVELIGETMAHLVEESAPDGGKRFFLSQGVLRVETVQSENAKITVTTPYAAIHAEGTFLCSTTGDATYVEVETGRIRLVRQADGKEIEVTTGRSVVAGADIEPMITKASARTLTTPLHHLKKVLAGKVAFSRDGAHLTTFDVRTSRVWNSKTGQQSATQESSLAEFRSGVLSGEGRLAVGSSKGGMVRVVDLASNREVWNVITGGKDIHALAISADGNLVATTETPEFRHALIRFFDGAAGKAGRSVRFPSQMIKTMAISADRSLLAAGSMKGSVFLVEPESTKSAVPFRELPQAIVALAFSPDGQQLTAVGNGSVVVWEVATRNELHRFQASGRAFLTAQYSPGGRYLATGTGDGTITLWNLQTGVEQVTLKADGRGVRDIAFSPDGRLLASAASRSAYIWRLPDDVVDPIK